MRKKEFQSLKFGVFVLVLENELNYNPVNNLKVKQTTKPQHFKH